MLKLKVNPQALKKTAKIIALVLAGVALLGFLLLPVILRPIIERKLAQEIHRKVAIRSLSFNPFTLSVALRGVTINERDSPDVMLAFDEFYVNLEALSVVKRGLIVSSVRLVKPYVRISRNKDLTYNFSDLIPPPAPAPQGEAKESGFRFSINNIEVRDGSADFYDLPKNAHHTLRNLHLSVPFVSNLPYYLASYVEPSFQATVNGTVIALKGKTRPFDESLESTVEIDLKGIDLPAYLAYSPVPLKVRLLSGRLDVQAVLSFRQFKDRPPKVSVKGTVALNNMKLADTGRNRLVEFSSLSVSFLPSELMEKEIHLSEVSLRGPKIYVERNRGGELVIVKAVLAQLGVDKGKPEPAARKQEGGELPIIDIDAFSIRDGMVKLTDWEPVPVGTETEGGPREPATVLIDGIVVKAGPLSTRKDKKGKVELSLTLNRKGTIRTAGTLGLVPFDLDTTITISDIALPPFQPYVSQRAEILVKDGRFSAKGLVRVSAGKQGALSTTYRGSASIAKLDVRDSRNDDQLLAWNRLAVDGIDAAINPVSVRIKTITLSDFFAGITVEEDGGLNLSKVVKQAAETPAAAPAADAKIEAAPTPAEPAPEPASPPQISIGQVLLRAGTLGFTDRHVKPLYTATLLDIDGRVTGLSSKQDLLADVLLRASFDQYAPLEVTGKIHPLGDLSADIRADFKDMELSQLTPYSGTYIGNAIEKGKLSFGLEYHIANKKLAAKNNIFIDQLTLGEKVDSPLATKLPVALAIALLKDRKGEIKLDIPVEGEIDNPEFRVWKVVLQVIVNLLTKAALSPFALLGSMMGGEELGYVEFDYGASALSPENAKKIESLVNALFERPALKLEITGYADPANDREALRAARMKNLIAAEKIKDLPRKERDIAPESVQVTAAEYPVYLKKAYRSGKFAKPRNLIGMAKDIPDAEMEKLLLASIQISDDDLRQLASSRARIVRDAILRSQKIGPERVFLLEPKSLSPEQKGKLRGSRVDFSLE